MEESPYRIGVAGVLLLLIVAEMVWSWRNDKKVYQVKETLTNLGIMAGFQLSFSRYSSHSSGNLSVS